MAFTNGIATAPASTPSVRLRVHPEVFTRTDDTLLGRSHPAACGDYEKPRASVMSVLGWIDRNILSLGREMRLSYLPPLMVYVAAGVSGLPGIVGTFFVKEYLGLSAEFLAVLGFCAGIPWALQCAGKLFHFGGKFACTIKRSPDRYL